MPPCIDTFNISHRQWSRTDQTHVAVEHIEELRQLIDTETSQEFTHTGNTRILFDLERRAIDFIKMLNHVLLVIRPVNHCAKFQNFETPLIQANPLLRKEYRPRGV